MKNKKWLIGILAVIIIVVGAITAIALNQKQEKDMRNVKVEVPADAETVKPTIETSNIDGVSYETLNAENIDGQVFAHVFVEGPYENVSKFVLPYSDFVKDLNPGISDVIIKVYYSKEDYESNNPIWQYADGVLVKIQTNQTSTEQLQ